MLAMRSHVSSFIENGDRLGTTYVRPNWYKYTLPFFQSFVIGLVTFDMRCLTTSAPIVATHATSPYLAHCGRPSTHSVTCATASETAFDMFVVDAVLINSKCCSVEKMNWAEQ